MNILMKKLRVMHVLNTGDFSGAENVAISIIEYLKPEYDFVYVSLKGTIEDILRKKGIKHYAIKKLNVHNIRQAINDIKPDIIHAHDYTAGIISSLSTLKIPIINHLHNNSPWIKRYGMYSFAYIVSSIRYCKVLMVSESILNEYVFGNLIKGKSEIIGNPIDFKKIQNLAVEAHEYEESDIIFLGRLSPPKKPLFFLEIVDDLQRELPDIRTFMIGDGELWEEVKKKVVEIGVSKNVKLMGFMENPYGYLKHTQVLCMPSEWEGFGLVAVEALSLGIPVVCSGVGGLKDIVNNECGMICGGKETYVEEIKKLLLDNNYYSNKSLMAKMRLRELYNINEYYLILSNNYQLNCKRTKS